MRILADKNIPYVHRLFGLENQIQVCDGRMITHRHIKYIDTLIVRSVTKVNHELLQGSSIKFIGSVTSGIDHIDNSYLKKCNIKFVSAPGSNAISVVEYVLSALFWLAKRDHFFLRDKIVGIVGFGNIGALLYQRLNNLGVATLLCDPYLSNTDNNKNWKSLEELVSKSDILTFHTPLTYTGDYPTWHMVNLDVLEALPEHSILINTSRGEVIDNIALLNILQSGKKINVVLDVWESEPDISLSLLSYVDIGTAHIAGYTFESKIRSVMQIYNQYCNYFNVPNKIYKSCLFSEVLGFIRVKKIDEIYLGQLINFVYDIYRDHLALKYFASKPGWFDVLRRYYYNRREWSALFVTTGKDCNDEILVNLGFGAF